MPLFDLFWSMLWFFMFFAWIWLLIKVFADIFRLDSSGWAKAGWTIFVVILPMLGVLVYLIAQGGGMAQRDMQQAAAIAAAQRSYIQEAAGSSASAADELSKLAALRESGALTNEEFETQKAKILA
jgi:hypothetical protein